MKPPPRIPVWGVFAALVAYFVLFFAAPLPSLPRKPVAAASEESSAPQSQSGKPALSQDKPAGEGRATRPWRRVELLTLLLLPEDLLESWFGTPPELAILDRLPVLGLAGAILAWAGCFGWLMMVLCRADRGLTETERFVFSMGVGLNAVSTYTLAIGLAGWLNHRLVFILPAALTVGAAAWLGWQRRGRGATGREKSVPGARQREEGLGPRWLWLAAPFVLVVVLGGMLPPIEFDVREYHLQAPKEFFQQGRIAFLPHNVYANMALGSEMLSLPAMVLAGDWWLGALAGKTVIALFAPLGALALVAAGRRFFSPGAGVVAAILYVSTPWVVQVSNFGLVEGAFGYYLLLAVYALLIWRRESKEGPPRPAMPRLLLAGYMAGSAAASKYPGVLFVVIPLAAWLVWLHLPREWPKAWKPAGLFLLAAALGCGLWFGRNWALTGNPTYPLMYKLFGGTTWTDEKDRFWNQVHMPQAHTPDGYSPRALAGSAVGVLGGSEWLSPLLMPLAALALVRPGNRRLAAGLAIYFGFVIAAWWLVALRADRYWVPALPLVALLAGAGSCWSGDRAWRRGLIALLVAASVYNFVVAAGGPGGYNRYFARLQRLRTARERLDPWHRYFNAHAAGGRVLLVGEAQVFDFEVPILYNTWLDDSIFERLVGDRPPEEVRARLRGEQVGFIYVHWGEIARYRATGYGRWDFVRPEVFDRLVRAGVIEPLPAIDKHPGRGYRVIGAAPTAARHG